MDSYLKEIGPEIYIMRILYVTVSPRGRALGTSKLYVGGIEGPIGRQERWKLFPGFPRSELHPKGPCTQ